MKDDDPRPKGKGKEKEIRELIRVKVDLYGLTEEDIDYLIEHGLARVIREGGERDQRRQE
jgi:3-oxoacyl-(acyl-carrier-protein) synthase